MTRARRLATVVLVGVTVVGVGLGSNGVLSSLRPARGGEPQHLEISSLDLTMGTRDAVLSAHGMLPGDVVTAAVTVSNSGRQSMTYAMSRGLVSAGGAALSAALVLTIKTIGSSCADFDGETLFEGPLDQAAFGSPANGRPLPAATADILCFRAALPRAADDGLQGAATTITLSFGSRSLASLR